MAKTVITNEQYRKLRIRSDGTGPGTTIELVSDDGSDTIPLTRVRSVTWTASVDGIATATLEFIDVEVDVVGEERP